MSKRIPFTYAGVEIATSATQYSLTLSRDPQARRWQARLPAPPAPEESVRTIAGLLRRACLDADIPSPTQVSLGVAIAATLDAAHAAVQVLPQAPAWDGFPLAQRLMSVCATEARLATITEASALAEARSGAGAALDNVLYLLLARSVTCCSVWSGRVHGGAHGRAGQLGHTPALGSTAKCACGGTGHLDTVASAQSIVRNFIGRASATDESTAAMLAMAHGRAEALTAPQVVALAQTGDPAAQSVVEEAVQALSSALELLVAVLDPGVIVLGGPLATVECPFTELIQERLRIVCAPRMTAPMITRGALEPRAALIGAHLLASVGDAFV